eukprot:Filipodium_phascolosomae@DN7958_c0_g1_i1.p1
MNGITIVPNSVVKSIVGGVGSTTANTETFAGVRIDFVKKVSAAVPTQSIRLDTKVFQTEARSRTLGNYRAENFKSWSLMPTNMQLPVGCWVKSDLSTVKKACETLRNLGKGRATGAQLQGLDHKIGVAGLVMPIKIQKNTITGKNTLWMTLRGPGAMSVTALFVDPAYNKAFKSDANRRHTAMVGIVLCATLVVGSYLNII